MSELPIEANICEIDGPFFRVKLHAIPQRGDLINLFSYLYHAAGVPPKKHYEVVQVVHHLHDMDKEHPELYDGHQFLMIYVKPATGPFFEE